MYGRYKRRYRRSYGRRYRRFFKRFYRRRMTRKSRMGRIRTRNMGFLLSDRLKVKLRFTSNVAVVLDNNGNQATAFSGNNAFDPDDSGTANGQPTGWDIYTQLYRFWYCSGSKITVRFINPNNDLSVSSDPVIGPMTVGIVPGTNILSNTDMVTMQPRDWPYSKEVYINSFPALNSKTIKTYIATKKIYGYSTANNSNFVAAVTSAPTNKWYWNVYAQSAAIPATSGVGKEYYARIQIVYYVNFFSRVEIPTS